MLYRVLLLIVATVSAFEAPVLSRRAFAQAIATAAPFAAVGAAFADADNAYLGAGKAGAGAGLEAKFNGAVTVAVGRPGAQVDASGAIAPKGIAAGSTKAVAAAVGPPGEEKTAAQKAALARMLAK